MLFLESSSGPSKSEKMSSTGTGKRNIGSIIGAVSQRSNIVILKEVAGGLLSSEKTSNGRRHVGATIGGKHSNITGMWSVPDQIQAPTKSDMLTYCARAL